MSDDLRRRQAEVMGDPDRVQLLSLVLSDPAGETTADSLAGEADVRGAMGEHLEAMVAAGLLEADGTGPTRVYRATYDALARFGALLQEPGPVQPPGPMEMPEVLDRIADTLVDRFVGTLSAETVREFVAESYSMLASRAKVRTFLPVLTARFAADRLSALAATTAGRRRKPAEVLFVCVHNAGRSQLAAAALRSMAGERIGVRTAGSQPSHRIDSGVMRVIETRGWTPALEYPKPLTDEVVRAADFVVTMGCGDACPVVPGRRYLDWPLPDLSGLPHFEVDAVADEIERLVSGLVDEILGVQTG